MARTKDKPHNAATLRTLASRFRMKAEELEALAVQLEGAAGKKYVRVGHMKAVDGGLTAVDLMQLEIEGRITAEQFTTIKR